ncbi:MAG TPA: TonB family protein [Candidatus Acidoferrales bacterium]|nr:TonB family protein [Candidatus Acidoferrales bacterium]
MTSRQARRLLIVAFALSLLIHLTFAIAWRRLPNEQPGGTEVVSIEHRRTAILHMATPPPRPKATPVAHPRPAARPLPHPARHGTPARAGAGTAVAASAPPPPAPTPVATAAAAACAKSNAGAAVLASPPPPEIPAETRAQDVSGIAVVDVKLDDQGDVTGANVTQSTGNSSLDLVAVSMARSARYAPATHDCKPVAATYSYSVKFVAW